MMKVGDVKFVARWADNGWSPGGQREFDTQEEAILFINAHHDQRTSWSVTKEQVIDMRKMMWEPGKGTLPGPRLSELER